MKSLLVVGGAGYIGSHVVRALLDQKFAVTVFDNLSSGRRENLFSEADFIQGDVLDFDNLRKAMGKGFDGIVHLAAFKAAGESMKIPEKYSVNNIVGAINLLNAASETGVRNIVFSSTAAVYGDPIYVPIDEKHPTIPINYYGFTKLEIERFLDWYDRLKNIKYAALRYFNAAGYDTQGRISGLERNQENLLPVVMEAAAGMRESVSIFGNDYSTPDGTGVRDYVHVNDLADAHVLAFNYIDAKKESLMVNLGSENGISVKEMIDTARAVSNRPILVHIAPRRPGDAAKCVASSAKAFSLLGWKAKRSDAKTLIESTWNVYKHIKNGTCR
jgi:UDP-glucose 4-epimerase